MRFSTKELYGLRAMAEIARNFGSGPVSLSAVAEAESLPPAYLEQIVVPLKKEGLLLSQRGARGGYELARDPQEITVGDVIRAVEGSIVQIPCLPDTNSSCCAREVACVTRNVWAEVRRKLIDTMDSITLADLVHTVDQPSCQVLFADL